MTTATMSILGLYNWMGDTLFTGLTVPTGVDRALCIKSIILENAELELVYPDGDFMKQLICYWSDTEQHTWVEFMKAVNAEYNPIENYDRQETWTDNGTGESTTQGATQSSGTDTNKVTGYNDNTLTNNSAVDSVGSGSTSGSASSETSNTHTGRVHGNIGVTTAPKMLTEFIEVTPKLNIYQFIAHSFKTKFCLEVY